MTIESDVDKFINESYFFAEIDPNTKILVKNRLIELITENPEFQEDILIYANVKLLFDEFKQQNPLVPTAPPIQNEVNNEVSDNISEDDGEAPLPIPLVVTETVEAYLQNLELSEIQIMALRDALFSTFHDSDNTEAFLVRYFFSDGVLLNELMLSLPEFQFENLSGLSSRFALMLKIFNLNEELLKFADLSFTNMVNELPFLTGQLKAGSRYQDNHSPDISLNEYLLTFKQLTDQLDTEFRKNFENQLQVFVQSCQSTMNHQKLLIVIGDLLLDVVDSKNIDEVIKHLQYWMEHIEPNPDLASKALDNKEILNPDVRATTTMPAVQNLISVGSQVSEVPKVSNISQTIQGSEYIEGLSGRAGLVPLRDQYNRGLRLKMISLKELNGLLLSHTDYHIDDMESITNEPKPIGGKKSVSYLFKQIEEIDAHIAIIKKGCSSLYPIKRFKPSDS